MSMAEKLKRSVMLHSTVDTIRVLENSPVRPDMIVELTIAQVMNRVSSAHLSIERAMKFLITEAGGPVVKDHDLPSRLKELRRYEPSSACFMEEAFNEAVQHYGYNANASPMKHLQSLETYLYATGSDKDFQDIRYWELNQSTSDLIVRQIYLTLHIELLHAVKELLMPPGRVKETTSVRVEKAVQREMRPRFSYVPGTDKELSVKTYLEWLNGFDSDREAITKALRLGGPPDEEFTLEIIKKTHQELASSTDPAVKYFAEILTVLPHQPRDAVPCIEWLGPEEYQTGKVSTPAGDNLGFIFRRPDGLWNIEPAMNGPVMITDIAETQTDARSFLAEFLTRPVWVTVNGDERTLRIFGEEHNLFNRNFSQDAWQNDATQAPIPHTHEVAFWHTEHGLADGDSLKLVVPSRQFKGTADVLEGTVTQVAAQKVYILGIDSIAIVGSC